MDHANLIAIGSVRQYLFEGTHPLRQRLPVDHAGNAVQLLGSDKVAP